MFPSHDPDTTLHVTGGVTGTLGGDRVAILEGNLPELLMMDTNNSEGFATIKYGNQVYFSRTNSSGVHQNYMGMMQMSSGKWRFGDGSNPGAQVHIKSQGAANVVLMAEGISGQAGNMLELNTNGGSGGDVFLVDAVGNTVLNASSYLRVLYDGTTSIPALQIGDSEVGLNGFGYDAANGIRVISGGSYSHTFSTRQIHQGAYGGPGTEYIIKAQYPIGWTNQTGTDLGLYAGS